ncbi:MAG TPA: nicotinic acid mononucleotide adenylyltransferase [Alphaproteobacteria bacterium]|jgi:nicotinate-nucleotide adenylyltransferase|nr:MAG: nicotinate-nicotinamide nucleotide adenylyltransferase [Candidatus Puniceispirillum sp. TMED245]HCV87898.1 nicotinic acid mononucleotide adenylyltransferase [Alphaproteobacteria bacterium]
MASFVTAEPDHLRRHRIARLFQDGRRLRIGLFGGSFNPAHEGHLHLADMARRQLGLDEIWWLVSPQNPLKPSDGMAPLRARLDGARHLVASRRHIRVMAPEVEFGTTLTHRTLLRLRQRCPRHRFCWLMGADNLVGFASWQRHDVIARTMPIAVIDRPGYSYAALSKGRLLLRSRLSPRRLAAATLRGSGTAPAWCFIAGRRHHASATALRRQGRKDGQNQSRQGAFVERHN